MLCKLLYGSILMVLINMTVYQPEDSNFPICLKAPKRLGSKRACTDKPHGQQMKLADDPNNDTKKIQGVWGAIKFTLAGIKEVKDDKLGSPEDSPIKFSFDGKDMTILAFVHQDTLKGPFNLDPTQTPKTIDVTFPPPEGKTKNEILEGIYKFDGDTLVICFKAINVNGKRPREFKAGADTMLFTFKKLKK